MPYKYRKLSPKEREEIVNDRRMQGYPLHAPPHPFREAGAYLISAANFEHKAVMKTPARRTEFETLLLNTLQEIANDLILATVQSLDHISKALKYLHGQLPVCGISKINERASAASGTNLQIHIFEIMDISAQHLTIFTTIQ